MQAAREESRAAIFMFAGKPGFWILSQFLILGIQQMANVRLCQMHCYLSLSLLRWPYNHRWLKRFFRILFV